MKRFLVVGLLCAGACSRQPDARLVRAQQEIADISANEMRVLLRDVTHLQEVLDRTETARIDEERRAEEARQLLRSLEQAPKLPDGMVTTEKARPPVDARDMKGIAGAVRDLEVRAGMANAAARDDGEACPRDGAEGAAELRCSGEPPLMTCEGPGSAWLVSTAEHRAQVWPLPTDSGWSVMFSAPPGLAVLVATGRNAQKSAHVVHLGRTLWPLAGWPLDGADVRVADLDGDGQEDVLWKRGDDAQAVMQDGGAQMAHVLRGKALRDVCGSESGPRLLGPLCAR